MHTDIHILYYPVLIRVSRPQPFTCNNPYTQSSFTLPMLSYTIFVLLLCTLFIGSLLSVLQNSPQFALEIGFYQTHFSLISTCPNRLLDLLVYYYYRLVYYWIFLYATTLSCHNVPKFVHQSYSNNNF